MRPGGILAGRVRRSAVEPEVTGPEAYGSRPVTSLGLLVQGLVGPDQGPHWGYWYRGSWAQTNRVSPFLGSEVK